MKAAISSIKVVLVVLIVVGMCAPAFAYQKPKPIPGQYIVMLDKEKIPPAIKNKPPQKKRPGKVKKIKEESAKVKKNEFVICS